MQFIKYPSLTNHYTARRQKFINFDDDYVATEKSMVQTYRSWLTMETTSKMLSVQLY